MMRTAPGSRLGLTMAVVASLLLSAGCAPQDSGNSTVTLTVSDFGNFGFKSLMQEYHRTHPNIRVVERVGDYQAHHDELAKQLDRGKGAADIVGIDDTYIPQFRDRPNAFYNLFDFGATSIKGRWLDWKWQQSLSVDGKVQIGLGTDVGSLGVCYRRDLFAQAGLPTDREMVGRLWSTWEDYIAVGRTFEAAQTSVRWVDSSIRVYNAVLAQHESGYYDNTGNVVVATNPSVQRAFDFALQLVSTGESAKLKSNTAPWTAALQAGKFATMMCPAWALGQLQQSAPDARGKWDLAAVPGGGGNWGGSFLAIPKQSRHAKEAYQLAAWLTAPEQQLRIFKETGNLPSQPTLYSDPALTDFKNEFVNNAPVGVIFGVAAAKLRPQYLGPKTSVIRAAIENVLTRVESGEVAGQQAWATALSEVGAAIAN